MIVTPNTPVTQRNLTWPMRRGGRGLTWGVLYARYHAAVHNFVRTPLGSLRWAPGYGSLVDELRTQNVTPELATEHESLLILGLQTFIPDIVVLAVKFYKEPQSSELTVKIIWDIPNATARDWRGDVVAEASAQTTIVKV